MAPRLGKVQSLALEGKAAGGIRLGKVQSLALEGKAADGIRLLLSSMARVDGGGGAVLRFPVRA